MYLEVVRAKDELNQEVWTFDLSIGFGSDRQIYLETYTDRTKSSRRHKNWVTNERWARLMQRDSTIKDPPLPADVETEAREGFAIMVKALPIKK